MGKDMSKVIRKNKDLKRKKFKIKNRALNNYSSWKNMQSGDGVKKTFFKTKAPSILQIDKAVSLAPSTISVYDNGKVQYRGEKTIQDGSGFFSSAQYLQRNPGMGGRLKRKQIKSNKCINEIN